MSKSQDSSSSNPNFLEIDRIRDPDGIAIVVTENVKNGRVSFAFVREFEANGETRQSNYLSPRHLDAVLRLVTDVRDRELLELAEDRARARRRSA